MRIQGLQGSHTRQRGHKGALAVFDQIFYVPLFVARSHVAETGLKVVGQSTRHPTQKGKGVDMTIQKTLQTLLKIGAHIGDAAVAQTQAKKEDFLLLSIDPAPGFPPIDLALLSRVKL